jgi:hypothetical protein
VATFGQGGTLHVKAVKNNAPAKTYVKVFRQSDNKYIRDGFTREDGTPAEFKLLPDTYKIWLQDQSLKQKPVIEIENVAVKPAQTTERVATFGQGGTLHVKAVKNNAPAETYVKVFRQSDDKYMGDGWTREDGTPAEFKLLPDTYKIWLQDQSVKQRPVVEIANVPVQADQTVERIATFTAGGTLHVKAVKNSAPAKTYVKVFRQSDDKYMGDGWTREDGTPAEFKLLPDTYKIWLQDRSDKQRPEVWIENVQLQSGQTVERFATFPPPAAAPAPSPAPAPAAEPGQKEKAPPASAGAPSAEQTVMDGQVPVFPGAEILQEQTYGPSAKVVMQAPATPQQVVDFYKEQMAARGWQIGMAMVQGENGAMMLAQGDKKLMVAAQAKGSECGIALTLIGQ